MTLWLIKTCCEALSCPFLPLPCWCFGALCVERGVDDAEKPRNTPLSQGLIGSVGCTMFQSNTLYNIIIYQYSIFQYHSNLTYSCTKFSTYITVTILSLLTFQSVTFSLELKKQKQIKHGFLNVYLHNNQMIWNDNLRMVYHLRSGTLDIPFIFIARKNKSAMAKCKLHLEQKQPHCTAHTALALCRHLHRQHANAKASKESTLQVLCLQVTLKGRSDMFVLSETGICVSLCIIALGLYSQLIIKGKHKINLASSVTS